MLEASGPVLSVIMGCEASSGRCLVMREGSSRERMPRETHWSAAIEVTSLVHEARRKVLLGLMVGAEGSSDVYPEDLV